MNKKNFFFDNYYSFFLDLKKTYKEIIHKINFFCNLIKKTNRQKNKILFFGNEGNEAIASHVAIDLTK
jgi:phosphoheptose isomerase